MQQIVEAIHDTVVAMNVEGRLIVVLCWCTVMRSRKHVKIA
jgi:hypothetical protein